ncbi:hypothetical protein QLX08_006614 [Tetragonisca angustula]|uniref:Uncharacterized protein n=1 Tax=Tetragonisca angustula TaxID=166442 RepID=A0AAW0ZTZ4_9HYME
MQGINHVPFPCYNEKLEKAHLFFEEKLTEAFVVVAEEAIKYLENKEPNIKINADDFLSSNINTEVTNNLYGQLIMERMKNITNFDA